MLRVSSFFSLVFLLCFTLSSNAIAGAPVKKPENPALKGLPHFASFKEIIVPIIKRGRLIRTIGVVIELEVANEKDIEKIDKVRPLLRHQFIMSLSKIGRRLRPNHEVNLFLIKESFQKTCDHLLGKGFVKAILIKSELSLTHPH